MYYTENNVASIEEGIFPVLCGGVVPVRVWTHRITFNDGQVCLAYSARDAVDWMNRHNPTFDKAGKTQ
jgi:hypothetical protein